MADTLKNRIRFSSTLSAETEKLLKQYSSETSIPISKILDMAIVEYIKKHSTQNKR